MEWTEDSILNLIENYKLYPLLWNPLDVDYYKKPKKMDAWRNIAAKVGRTEDDCKKKMISLLSSHRREKSKAKKAIGNRKGSSKVYTSRWFAYEAFKFLEGKDKTPSRVDTEPSEMIEVDSVQETTNTRSEDEEFTTPVAPKRTRESRQGNGHALSEDLIDILRASAGRLNPSTEHCEIKSFCAFLSSKMTSYSKATRLGVQHAIYDILIKADRGIHEPLTHNHSQDQPCPPSFPDKSSP